MMKRKFAIAPRGGISAGACGSADRLTIPQIHAILQLIHDSAADDITLCEFAAQIRSAQACLNELRGLAHEVMVEAEAERAGAEARKHIVTVKAC